MGAITTLLGLLAQFTPQIAGVSTATIASIIAALTELVPVVVKQVQDVTPSIKLILAALRENPASTTEQLDALDALEAQLDAAFDAAVAKAEAEDKAAGNS